MTEKLPPLSAWHAGETFVQEHVGVAERMAAVGKRVIRDFMPDQHREFYAQLPFVVLGSVDADNDAWATILAGKPGFMSSPSPTTLHIATHATANDPAGAGMQRGQPIGLLGIEMQTRRRNRMNGIITDTEHGLRVDVDQSFGNCPRYIQLRDVQWARDPAEPFSGTVEHLADLDGPARRMITQADAFFVASYADREQRRQVDVSHRGGRAGFVRIDDDGLLTIPDFDGNLFFSTLGNFVLNGKAGLVFVDDEHGDLLQMTGDAALILTSPDIEAFQGAERLWTFRPRRIVRRANALSLRWLARQDGWSPHTLMTGDWTQAADRLRAVEQATRWRPFTVTRIVDESASIRSFHLAPADGFGQLPHKAGQHLPVRVHVSASDRPLVRTYTLSSAPSDNAYRISVKREGAVSRHLHDHIVVGDTLDIRAPAGAFSIDTNESRPAVLMAAGVGITPMLAMLRHIVYEGLRKQRVRPTILFHAARSVSERPFDKELADLVQAAGGAVKVVRVLSDTAGAAAELDYELAGRIDMSTLKRFLSFDDYDFYLCGPALFMQSIYDGLRSYSVSDTRVHAEAFGPSSLIRQSEVSVAPPDRLAPSDKSVPIVFMDALKEARWEPGSGNLLELAEARGLDPEFSCRQGSCGTCRTKLLAGVVTYVKAPTANVADDEILICCAVPALQENGAQEAIHLAL